MKKSVLFFLLFIGSLLQAKTIEVCKTCPVSTIKKAIQLAENGDEIHIKKGVYKENNIELNKSLKLHS